MVERVDLNTLAVGAAFTAGPRLTPKTVRSLRAAARKQGKTLSEVAEERLVVA